MFFVVMMELGLAFMILGGICTAIGKLPMLKRTHEARKNIQAQRKMAKRQKRRASRRG